MDINKFINNLEQYIGKKIDYEIIDNMLKVHVDNEICYSYDWKNMKAYMYERNIKTEIGIWETEKTAKINFSMLMRNVFKNDKDDTMPYELEKCNSLDELKLVFGKYADKEYFSIGSAPIGKVSLVMDDGYEILYKTDKEKYIIDKDLDEKYIFGRFYYEVTYFASFMKHVKEYETIFHETFSEEEIINLIGY